MEKPTGLRQPGAKVTSACAAKHSLGRSLLRGYHDFMELTLPEFLETRSSPRDAVLPLPIGLFVMEEATLGLAAQVAGLTQDAFLRELGKRRISLHYGQEELSEDLRVVEDFGQR